MGSMQHVTTSNNPSQREKKETQNLSATKRFYIVVAVSLPSPLAAEKKGEKAVRMGKNGKKRSHQQNRRDRAYYLEEEEQEYPAVPPTESPGAEEEQEDENPEIEKESQDDLSVSSSDVPSKFSLYQQSVQARNTHLSKSPLFLAYYISSNLW